MKLYARFRAISLQTKRMKLENSDAVRPALAVRYSQCFIFVLAGRINFSYTLFTSASSTLFTILSSCILAGFKPLTTTLLFYETTKPSKL